MADQRSGLATALQQAMASQAGDDDGQVAFEGFEAEAPLPLSSVASSSKGGRPKGARNKSTEAWREYLLSRYRSPLVTCLEIASRSPEALATEWGLYRTTHEGIGETQREVRTLDTHAASQIIMDAAKAALPYLHQRQPLAVEAPAGRGLGVLVIGDLGADLAAGDLSFANVDGNQGLIDVTPEKSDGIKSDNDKSSS